MAEPTFVFDDSGKAYAYLDGKIIASADDADALEAKLAYDPNGDSALMMGDPSMGDLAPGEHPLDIGNDLQACENCGNTSDPGDQFCSACGSPLAQAPPNEDGMPQGQADLPAASPDTLPGDDLPPRMTHIKTPNGLEGQILGKVKSLWGEQVTIRLANGRIAKFDVTPESEVEYYAKVAASTDLSKVAQLQTRLDEVPDGTKASLVTRIKELKSIQRDASSLLRSSREEEENKLHNIVVVADHELREVTDALSALEDTEPYAPPAPFETQVVEQESLGGGDSSWLDRTFEEMAAEAEATDFDQMMEEGPELLVSELETPALEDAEGVQAYASSHVASKTAGLEPESVADFRKAFLARVEEARQTEIEGRNERQETQSKEASAEDFDGPDDALFM